MQLEYMRNVYLKSARNVLKTEGPKSLIIESLRFLSLYYTPDKIFRYWLHRLAGTDWVMREVQGSLMLLNLKEKGIHIDLYLNGIREPRATKYLQSILQPDWQVIDAGANIGYYALQEGKKCSYVIALEPDRKNYDLLKLNVLLNDYTIQTENLAVGDITGKVRFDTSKISNWRMVSPTGNTEVDIIKLDDLLTAKFDFLRMDVEGYELDILLGAEYTIKNNRLGMFIEVHNQLLQTYNHTVREFYEFLAGYDYQIEKSFVMAPTREGPAGKISDILKDEEAFNALAIKSIASHVFFRR